MMKKHALGLALAMTTTVFAAQKSVQPPATAVPPAPAASADAQESCKRHAHAIDMTERQLAMKWAEGASENSAPRQTARLLEEVMLQQQEQMQMQLMIYERCSAIPSPGTSVLFYKPALECSTASLTRAKDADEKCDVARWAPMGAVPAGQP